MTKRSEMSWCSTKLFCKLLLVSILLQYTLGFEISEDDKRQGLIPLARLGGARLLTALDDKKHGSTIFYPRLGRRIWELHQTLIPYPRAGRVVVDPESLDYDIVLNADSGPSALEDTLTDAFLSNQHVLQKRPNVKLIPRIGRKKRSVSEEPSGQEHNARSNDQDISKDGKSGSFWDDLEDIDDDYFFRSDKKNRRSKNAFVPRIGKKRSEEYEPFDEKRAAAFTPRIGRASLIPRVGRNDPRFRLKSRAAFIPRIGRRAALIPRIGRSNNRQTEKEGN